MEGSVWEMDHNGVPQVTDCHSSDFVKPLTTHTCMTESINRAPWNNTSFIIGRSMSHSNWNLEDSGCPMIKILLLGGARFTN
jgi:hypothetical protein